jgi:hypothetical protein
MQVSFNDMKAWGKISDEAKDLVMKMLNKESEERYSMR